MNRIRNTGLDRYRICSLINEKKSGCRSCSFWSLYIMLYYENNERCNEKILSSKVREELIEKFTKTTFRINPTRWADRIAMRVELYGCEYISDTLYFDGNAMLSRKLIVKLSPEKSFVRIAGRWPLCDQHCLFYK